MHFACGGKDCAGRRWEETEVRGNGDGQGGSICEDE